MLLPHRIPPLSRDPRNMMNASRPLVTPEELQCLLGWPVDEVQEERAHETEAPMLPGWTARTPAPASAAQATGFGYSA